MFFILTILTIIFQQSLAAIAQLRVQILIILFKFYFNVVIAYFLNFIWFNQERRRAELLAFEQEQAKRLTEEAQLRNSSQANHNKVSFTPPLLFFLI